MLNRWVEEGSPSLLEVAEEEGMGVIAFTPLAQGLLTDRYLAGIPEDSRAAAGKSFAPEWLSEQNLERVRGLNDLAAARGQSLAQLAIAWILRGQRRGAQVTSALIGASSVQQLEQNLASVRKLEFSPAEIDAIDRFAVESGIDLWRQPPD
jgi:L-glyceraldehyde 3-phosphate reductase